MMMSKQIITMHATRPGLLRRVVCGALSLMLALGAATLLRGSFNVPLPVAHADVAPVLVVMAGETWRSSENVNPVISTRV